MRYRTTAHITTAGLMAMLLFAGTAAAAEVYKWVDENGAVHFGDRRQAEDAEAIEVKPAAPAARDARQRLERTQRVLEAFATERKERQDARLARREKAENRKRKCAGARAEQRRRETSPYLYYEDDDGNRRIIDGAEYDDLIKEAREAVTHWCS